ncbi:MAG: hypothetical protein PHU25_06335 [Deltaproteobacteria bacterium]|nr:hypothetical protein [Deltaproteobacteria bacterium]
MGVAALVLAVVGLTICWIPAAGWVGVLLAFAAMVLAAVAMTTGQKRLGIVGLALGAVPLILGLVIQIMAVLNPSVSPQPR